MRATDEERAGGASTRPRPAVRVGLASAPSNAVNAVADQTSRFIRPRVVEEAGQGGPYAVRKPLVVGAVEERAGAKRAELLNALSPFAEAANDLPRGPAAVRPATLDQPADDVTEVAVASIAFYGRAPEDAVERASSFPALAPAPVVDVGGLAHAPARGAAPLGTPARLQVAKVREAPQGRPLGALIHVHGAAPARRRPFDPRHARRPSVGVALPRLPQAGFGASHLVRHRTPTARH